MSKRPFDFEEAVEFYKEPEESTTIAQEPQKKKKYIIKKCEHG